VTAAPPSAAGRPRRHALLGDRLQPTSYRATAVVGILVAFAAIALVALALNSVIAARAQDEVEQTLAQQADAVAQSIVRNGRADVAASLAEASRLLPDTRVVVRIDGVDQYWTRPRGETFARARVTRDWATVTLERVDPVSAVGGWLLLAVVTAGIGAAAAIAWMVGAALARRLEGRLRDLTLTARRVSDGHLEARARESADEVGELARSFNHMTARLQAADERQREFLADVAHELRTPVTAIEGFATALEDGTARTDDDRREAAEFIREEAARLRDLVRDLQTLTWLDLSPPVRAEPADLAELGREAVARLSAQAAARGVVLEGPVGRLPVVTDEDHVATILANLITNALRATPAGGRVEVRAGVDGGDAYMTVRDTGIGIREEHIPLLFDRLFRAEASRSRADDAGSGLGLSIVKRLTLLLNGRITVRSRPGEGSTFTVWLLGAAARVPVEARATA